MHIKHVLRLEAKKHLLYDKTMTWENNAEDSAWRSILEVMKIKIYYNVILVLCQENSCSDWLLHCAHYVTGFLLRCA